MSTPHPGDGSPDDSRPDDSEETSPNLGGTPGWGQPTQPPATGPVQPPFYDYGPPPTAEYGQQSPGGYEESAPYGYGQPGYGQQSYAQQGYRQPYGHPGSMPGAPYGVHPTLGIPYSDKQKVVAGVLQIVLPFGIGRMYAGHTGLGVAQLLVTLLTCGIGALWPFIDGILMLVTDSKDGQGRPLRP